MIDAVARMQRGPTTILRAHPNCVPFKYVPSPISITADESYVQGVTVISTTTSLPNLTIPGPLIEMVPNARRLRPHSKRTPRKRQLNLHQWPLQEVPLFDA
jgi:hypothetical protein